ncbi:LysR family transcriptional regulator ArgP [Psychromonas sp. PT13]|uniref:LysR family transcriptional regulator ArgP n=1 Tax=Psychromonas sp. PT13 TaxID=3439547 RepID=UPI003EBF8F93
MFSNIDYKLLKALDAVVIEQNFERAAHRLHITQSAISQRIKLLETQLGQPLLIRAQPIQPNSLGQQLLGHYQRVLQLEAELVNQFNDNDQQAQLMPIAVNADSLSSWFIPALTPLLQQKNIELNLYVEDESRTWERMRSGEALACVTSKEKSIVGSDSCFLGYMEYICVATPLFIQRFFKNGINKQSLSSAPATTFDQHDDIHIAFLAENFNLEKGQYPCHTVRSSEAFVDLTLASGGYSLNSRFLVEKYIQSGELINLLPDHIIRIPLYWHHWQLAGALMTQLTEDVLNYTQQHLPK